MTSPAGFFGKLPARGDFVERRLDRGFCRTLDDWLQAGMAESRARLGDRWLPLYLTAPLWRFAFSAGVCGARPVCGVMMPSVDRVGRYFPLIVAVHAEGVAAEWFEAAERLILSALEDDCLFERFDADVAALAPPATGHVHASDGCVWWSFGSDVVPPCALMGARLPEAHQFAALVTGDCTDFGWHLAAGRVFEGLPVFTFA
jgi:type VI secretion system protein ImpM